MLFLRLDTMSMMPPEGLRNIDQRLITEISGRDPAASLTRDDLLDTARHVY
jgi:hypothetical protein